MKLFIATPMYGGQCTGNFALCVAELRQHLKCEHRHYWIGNDTAARARNRMADAFLKSDCTHLLFWDGDIGVPNIEHLLAMLQHSDLDLIGAPYPKKKIDWKSVKRAVELGYDAEDLEMFGGEMVFTLVNRDTVRLDEPFEVKYVGCGLMLIKRETFEKISAPPCPQGRCYFAEDIWGGDYLTEDYWFCRLVTEAGMKVWLAPWVECTHMGGHMFRGNLMAKAIIDGGIKKSDAVAS